MIKFEIYRDVRGEYRWRLKASNGEIVAVSEGYVYKHSARNSAELVKKIASLAFIFELV